MKIRFVAEDTNQSQHYYGDWIRGVRIAEIGGKYVLYFGTMNDDANNEMRALLASFNEPSELASEEFARAMFFSLIGKSSAWALLWRHMEKALTWWFGEQEARRTCRAIETILEERGWYYNGFEGPDIIPYSEFDSRFGGLGPDDPGAPFSTAAAQLIEEGLL